MNKSFQIGTRRVGEDAPVFIVAELSANHNQDYNRALEIVHAAKEAGADAVKLQIPSLLTVMMTASRSRKEPSGTARHFTNSISRPTPPGNGSQS